MDKAKYDLQFHDPVQGAVVGDNNTVINNFQGNKGVEVQPNTQVSSLPVLNIPYLRNPFFTGREEIFSQLRDKLIDVSATNLIQPLAITGLGGIGKTQIAIEYTYRYRKEYRDILWISATSLETLITDFLALATLLHLPEKNEQDQNIIIIAVKRWFAIHNDWLLIMDNVNDLDILQNFLPSPENLNSHILLTTRAFATSRIATSILIKKMTQEEGTSLLLRRAGVLTPDVSLTRVTEVEWDRARAIYTQLDGLPLALDQAGAYIEETACTLSDYLDLYQTQRIALLRERGNFPFDHPESVATTFSLAFQRVEISNSHSAEILRLCTFLSADAIPEEIFTDYAPKLDPELQPIVANQIELNRVIKLLLNFSLILRNSDTKTLTIHSLVQAVLKDEMEQQMQRQWAERAVRFVSRSFPFANPQTREACQRFLPHAYVCEKLIEQWQVERIEAAGLLYRMGRYLEQRAQYQQAELLYQKALAICEKVKEPEGHNDNKNRDSGAANILSGLADVYQEQGKYAQAAQIYERVLNILKDILGSENTLVAISLKNLANVYHYQGNYVLAEKLFIQALKIQEKALGNMHHEVGVILNDLALLYQDQGKYLAAETFYKRALQTKEQEPESISLSSNLSNLANLYATQGRYTEAEPLSQRALAICEKIQGPEHPDVALRSNNLAGIYCHQGKYGEAEALFLQALAIYEQILGLDHPLIANTLNNLSALYNDQGNYSRAEPLLKRALDINERAFGPSHPRVAVTLSLLAQFYQMQHKYDQAKPLYNQAIAIWEQTLGVQPRDFIIALECYATLLRETNQEDKAKEIEMRAWKLKMEMGQINQRFGTENRVVEDISTVRPNSRRPKKGKKRRQHQA